MQALCFSCQYGEPITEENLVDGSVFVDRVVCRRYKSKRNPNMRFEMSIRVKCPYYVPDPEKIE